MPDCHCLNLSLRQTGIRGAGPSTLGTIVPFFYYNVFGNEKMRRKIFMGDTGSLCIGFILAYLAVSMSDVHIRAVGV